MNASLRTAATAGALLAVLAAGSACGRKTEPLTPDSPRPEAVTGLKIEVRDAVACCCSLGQITNALFEVGGQYRRSTM